MDRGSEMGTDGVVVESYSLDGALGVLAAVMSNSSSTRDTVRRNMRVREVAGVTTVVIKDPLRRIALNPARKLNPWVSLAEFPWLIAGRCDVRWLLPYLPRAADFADDGRHWRAGYGPRLRDWGTSGVDQLAGVIKLLRSDPSTRQAVMSIWDPAADLGTHTKDMPCTNWLHFQSRQDEDGRLWLDLAVVMRSNDVIWGFSGVNVVNFTLLLELVARLTDMRVGVYRHISTNMHAYDRHFTMLRNINEAPTVDLMTLPLYPHNNLAGFTKECRRVLGEVEKFREGTLPEAPPPPSVWSHERWLGDWAYFMALHPYRDRGAEWWADALHHVRDPAWRVAAAAYMVRRKPEFAPLLRRIVEGHGLCDDREVSGYMQATMEEALSA